MPAPALVLFDLGGVLFAYDPDRRWQRYGALAGLPAAEVARRLSASGYARACDEGRYRGLRAHQEGTRLLGLRLSMERFVDVWVSAFTPNLEVVDLARAVKPQAAVALLSNNSDLVHLGLEDRYPDALAPFMPRIFSADLGVTKPDPRVFLKAASLCGRQPEEILLIDDSAANTSSAAALGFQTHRFTGVATLRDALTALNLLESGSEQ